MSGPRNDPSQELVNRAVAAMRQLPVPAGPSPEIASQTLAALHEAAHRPRTTFLQRIRHMPWTSKATAVLATAASLLVVYLGLSSFIGSALAFSDVLQKIRQAKTMVCDFVTTYSAEEGQLPDEFTGLPRKGTISIDFGGDAPATLVVYEKTEFGQTSRYLFLGDKAYVWYGEKVMAITSEEASRQRGTEDWLSRLLAVRESPDRNLGEKTIDGRRAVGFEIAGWKMGIGTRPTKGSPTPADSDVRLRVWVDIEQNLPILLEIEQKMILPSAAITIHQQWDNIKWNVALNPAEFQPPSKEVLATAETTRLPAIDEAGFIDFMRAWIESTEKAKAGIDMLKNKAKERGEELPVMMTALFERATLDDGFPKQLDMATLSTAFAARATLANLGDTLAQMKPLPNDLNEQERAKIVSERSKESAMAAVRVSSDAMMKANVAAAFYRKLAAEQRDPEYFGAAVHPGDANAILLTWKLDDGRYRVIYGDLHAETIDAPQTPPQERDTQ